MQRTLVCALAIMGLACGSSAKTGKRDGASMGGAMNDAAPSGGASGTTMDAPMTGGGGSAGGVPGTGGSGAVDSGATAFGQGGVVSKATGGNGGPGTAGAGGSGTGGKGTGAGGATNKGSGGGTSSGGSKGSGGGTGTQGGFVTTPKPKDPIAAAAGLPHYYISNRGDDSNTGTSPEQAWATLAHLPADKPSAVSFERGGTFKARAGSNPAAMSVPKGSVWTAYGDGDKRPILFAEQVKNLRTGAVLSPGGDALVDGLGIAGQASVGLLVETDNNTIQDCEIDGSIEGNLLLLGFSIRGHDNLVVGNSVHALHPEILDISDATTSGGGEAFTIRGTGHEIAYNSVVDSWMQSQTLGGLEGGCLVILAGSPGEVVEDIKLHHNYCERSPGLFEAWAGNFTGTSERIQLHHAVVRNTYLAYNVAVDAMWLYLLQSVNTDFRGLIFEHNTVVHGPANGDLSMAGSNRFGIVYSSEYKTPNTACAPDGGCSEGARCSESKICVYEGALQPGDVTVRSNLFVVLDGGSSAAMMLPPSPKDVYDNIFAPKLPQDVDASWVSVVPDAGLVKTFRIAPTSPAVDKASKAAVAGSWVDFDGNKVPCGAGPDVGAIESCI